MSLSESWADYEDTDFDFTAEAAPEGPADSPDHRVHMDRLLGARARAMREAVADDEVYLARLGQLEAWIAQRRATHAERIESLEGVLHRFVVAVKSVDPKSGPIHLPNGTLSLRAQQPEIAVVDEQATIAWATSRDISGVLRRTEPKPPEVHVDKVGLRQWIGDQGVKERVEVPGVTWTERDPKLVVKAPEDAS